LVDFLAELAERIDREEFKPMIEVFCKGMTIIGEPPPGGADHGVLEISGIPIKFFNHPEYGVYLHHEDYKAFLRTLNEQHPSPELDTLAQVIGEGLDILVNNATEEM
jgi:hypothetical protein